MGPPRKTSVGAPSGAPHAVGWERTLLSTVTSLGPPRVSPVVGAPADRGLWGAANSVLRSRKNDGAPSCCAAAKPLARWGDPWAPSKLGGPFTHVVWLLSWSRVGPPRPCCYRPSSSSSSSSTRRPCRKPEDNRGRRGVFAHGAPHPAAAYPYSPAAAAGFPLRLMLLLGCLVGS